CHVGPQAVPLAIIGRRAVPQSLASIAEYRLAAGAELADGDPTPTGDPVLDEVRRRYAPARELSPRLAGVSRRSAPPAPLPTLASPAATLEGRLDTIRRLIAADSGFRVYYTSLEGFDTHASQSFRHQDLLRQVSQGVAGFLEGLRADRLDDRVAVLMFSEFG